MFSNDLKKLTVFFRQRRSSEDGSVSWAKSNIFLVSDFCRFVRIGCLWVSLLSEALSSGWVDSESESDLTPHRLTRSPNGPSSAYALALELAQSLKNARLWGPNPLPERIKLVDTVKRSIRVYPDPHFLRIPAHFGIDRPLGSLCVFQTQ